METVFEIYGALKKLDFDNLKHKKQENIQKQVSYHGLFNF